MIGTDTDKKHTALAVLVYELRQDIDLYRLIGLNAKQLKEKGVSKNLLGHIQSLAHRSIAVCVCKIFEDSNRYELNSIPRIIESLPTGKPNKRQEQKLSEFAMRYKNSSMVNETQAYLRDTLDTFKGR